MVQVYRDLLGDAPSAVASGHEPVACSQVASLTHLSNLPPGRA